VLETLAAAIAASGNTSKENF
jgi:hypothetical protein